MKRRTFSKVALLAPISAMAQSAMDSKSIGIGPFEFPITGTFTYLKANGATVIAVAGSDRTYTVGTLRARGRVEGEDRLSQVAALTKRSWERFAAEEQGKVVRQFMRTDLSLTLAVLSMATEFGSGASRKYYVQFAATTGDETAIIFAEGTGSALSALSELQPLVEKVQLVGR